MDIQTLTLSSGSRRVLRIFAMILVMAAMMALVVFADDNTTTITAGIIGGVTKVYGIIKAVTLPIAAVALAFCGLGMLFGGQKGMEQGRKYGLTILCVIAVVLLAPVIIQEIGSWFSSTSVDIGSIAPTH